MSEYVSNLSLRGIKLYSSLGMRRGGREREIREYIQSFSTEPDGRREREEEEEKEELGDLLPSFILGKVMNVGIGPSLSRSPRNFRKVPQIGRANEGPKKSKERKAFFASSSAFK